LASPTRPAPAPSTFAAPIPLPPTTRSANPIKVGVYLSHLTAEGSGQNDQRFGYNSQVRILRELKGIGDLDLRAVVEANTDVTDAELRRKLDVHFPGQQTVNVADASALRQLDVLVLNSKASMPDDAIAAIEQAVRGGVGLFVRQGVGDVTPGHTLQIARLLGLRQTLCARSNPTLLEVEVCGTHPILGALSGQMGRAVTLRANGHYGPLADGSVPLLRVRSMDPMVDCHGNPAKRDEGWMFHPLYVSEVGAGRVVVCAFAAYTETPADLMQASGNEFIPRSLRWLARRPLEAQ
jgi:hypothetical protein